MPLGCLYPPPICSGLPLFATVFMYCHTLKLHRYPVRLENFLMDIVKHLIWLLLAVGMHEEIVLPKISHL